MYVDTGRFLPQLLADFRAAGGVFNLGRFGRVEDLAALPQDLLFNCTGIGARALFGDDGLVPIRGQLAILAPQPEIGYAFVGRGGYMFPRRGEIILGGTFERENSSLVPDPATTRQILGNHKHTFENLRCTV
jgi:glycine/D-amino acid oxidase-like deaminating enzyme